MDGHDRRVVFISGGSPGIVKATAREFIKEDYIVAVSGPSKQQLYDIFEELRELDQITSDSFLVSVRETRGSRDCDAAIDQTIEKFKRLDVLVSISDHVGENCPFTSIGFFQDFQNVLNVNLMSVARLCQLAAPHLVKSSRGVVIIVSPVQDSCAGSSISYNISKAGLSMLVKTIANELEGRNVRIVGVASNPPGVRDRSLMGMRGELASIEPLKTIQDIAHLIKFLESGQASYMHGSTVNIDCGLSACVKGT